MSGVSGLVSNALTGLEAALNALQVTGNNISNVNTPGYSREQVVQSTQPASAYGGLYLGNGTDLTTVTRSYSNFVQTQVWSTTSSVSGANTLNSELQSLVNLVSGNQSGLSTSINQFFASGVAQVAANPSDIPSRQAMVSQAQTLAQTLGNAGAQLQSESSGVNQQIGQSITSINSLTRQIAQLNVQINSMTTSTNNPNTLLDQRDQLITQLSGQLGVSVLQQGNSLNVFTNSGQVLVAGSQSYALTTANNPYDPSQTEVAYASNGAILSPSLQGGTLGGLLQFRSQVLQPAQDSLGRIADALAQSMNQQQAQGLDMNGNLGGPMFASGPVLVLANSANTSGATISGSIVDANQLSGDNYRLKFDGTNWSATDLNTGQATSLTQTSSGGVTTLSFGGVQINVSGASAGNNFEVLPTRLGAVNFRSVLTDPKAIAAASPYVSSSGQMVSGSLQNSNLGNLALSSGQYASGSAGAIVVGGVSVPTALQVTLTSGGTSGSSVGFIVTQPGSSTVLASGSVSLGGSGTTLDIAYGSTPPGGYWSVNLSGNLAVSGDAFSLSPGGPGNGGNAQGMAALQSADTLSNGTLSLQGAYTQMVGQVASQGNQAQSALSAATAVAQQATAAQQSVSGVNLDQEAARLMQYQQAYQAAATAIQIGGSLFQSLITAVQSA
ncbi:flagellar hook-associated protein FlgK [Thiomonas sp. FB-6]|uniref:flagellar hook-associated protein FlgK n=1 Tax=Thiomonas sp. FB-6 TaxID=1158291 RepID=UPI00035C7BE5|nr:flagellar hook-associated protein FlgK [Thiomonas sp. FB-6]